MRCAAHLAGEPDGLLCVLDDGHRFGHSFTSSAGSEVPDRHGEEVSE